MSPFNSALRNVSNSGADTVFVIDDDESVRDALSSLFRSVGFKTRLFASTQELLQIDLPATPSCLVLDVRLPGISGLDFKQQLAEANINLPVIFMTGHGDIPMSVRAMKSGAVNFLAKPFRDQDMLDAVAEAIARDKQRLEAESKAAEAERAFQTLTARERDVMVLVAKGLLNKQVAAQLGLSEITVKIHRSRLMKKLGVRTLADLIQMVDSERQTN